jgi:hypothetical protein
MDAVRKTVGKRRIDASEAAAHDLQAAAAEFVGEDGICDRGVFRFETFEEADRWLMEQKIRRAHARRGLPTSRGSRDV